MKAHPDNPDLLTVHKAKEEQLSTAFFCNTLRVPNHSPLGKGMKSCSRSKWFVPIFSPHHELIIFFQGRNPIAVWVAFRTAETAELADFALTILKILVNQAGCERIFSDLKVKQTQRRNQLKLEKLDKMTRLSHPPSLLLFRILTLLVSLS
jgi:hypothetical protein